MIFFSFFLSSFRWLACVFVCCAMGFAKKKTLLYRFPLTFCGVRLTMCFAYICYLCTVFFLCFSFLFAAVVLCSVLSIFSLYDTIQYVQYGTVHMNSVQLSAVCRMGNHIS